MSYSACAYYHHYGCLQHLLYFVCIYLNSFIGVAFGFQNTVYHVMEDEGAVEVCMILRFAPISGCPAEFSIFLTLFTEDGNAGM